MVKKQKCGLPISGLLSLFTDAVLIKKLSATLSNILNNK